MFNRKALKQKGRHTLKTHYALLIFICLLSGFLGSEFYSALTSVKSEDSFIRENINLDSFNDSKVKANSRGVLAKVVNSFSSGEIYSNIAKTINSIIHSNSVSVDALILASAIIVFIISYFIQGIVPIILRRFFLESRVYKKIPTNRVFSFLAFKKWNHIAFTMFLKNVFQVLWSLTIVGGVIKKYSYALVPYILAENPNIKSRDAIKLSREMMYGYKWELFKFDLSFIGWGALGILTFGFSEVLYSNAYKTAAESEYFVKIRDKAFENKINNISALNDIYLYTLPSKEIVQKEYKDIISKEKKIKNNELILRDINGFKGFLLKNFSISLYSKEKSILYNEMISLKSQIKEDEYALKRQMYPIRLSNLEVKKRKNHNNNYLKSYSVTNLILLFFIFAFIGYIWEVSLNLITNGILVNKGILLGPWLPIYGSGCIVILTILSKFRDNPKIEFLLAVVLCGIIEYFTSVFMELTHDGTRWWDYSGYFLNLNGRICLEGLLVFGLGGLVVVYVAAPFFDNFLNKFNKSTLVIISIILISLFVLDQIHAKSHPNMGKGISHYAKEKS